MSVRLVVEHTTHPQPERERVVESGDLVIGRGADADWRLEDPDMYVSRTHAIVTVAEDVAVVRDASRGGLFVDGASQPLGAGNCVALEHGMRLRLGDVVLRVELQGAPAEAPKSAPMGAAGGGYSWDWGTPTEPEPQPRPAALPPLFEERPEPSAGGERRDEGRFHFDDPFTLDELTPPETAPAGEREAPEKTPGAFDWSFGEGQDDPLPEPVEAEPSRPRAVERPSRPEQPPSAGPREPRGSGTAVRATTTPADEDLLAAFYRGLGVPPPNNPDAAAELEEMGARFRLLADGLVRLLRTRAQEKQSVRVAQTIIGSSEVNPLKFAASTDDAVQSLVRHRGTGYLDPDAAIEAAFRDLADHQLRTWTALQSALRRMIDRFDPEAMEKEVEAAGLLQSLMSGGRGARLWTLYRERYRDIAKAAEDRFLGEIGADFRDAYEGRRRE